MKIDYHVAPQLNCLIGTLVRVDDLGRAFVIFLDNVDPLEARLALAQTLPGIPVEGAPVLLMFEDGDRSLPVIVGLVRDRFTVEQTQLVVEANRSKPREVKVDGRQIRFTATDQVVLQCGRGSITLSSDGSIEIKGTRIVSRSSGTHKIRGASVRIN